MRDRLQSEKSGSETVSPQVASKPSLFWLFEVALVVIGIWAYSPTLLSIFKTWSSNPDYSHGYLVPVVALGFLWSRRDLRPREVGTVCWNGLSLLVLAGIFRFLAGRFYLPEFDGWSIPLWMGGIVLLFHGPPNFRWALPSLAFLWFATPLPGSFEVLLSTHLQHLAAQLSGWTLRLVGMPAITEGTTILLGDQVLDIERACSGLRMFYGIFAIAVACVVLTRMRGWSAFVLLVAAAPVAVIANVCRIAVTGLLLTNVSSEAASSFSHDFAGFVMIPFAVLLFGMLARWLNGVCTRIQLNQAGGLRWLLNWSFAALVVVGAMFGWGRYQNHHLQQAFLDSADRCEQLGDWPWEAFYLQRYLQANPDDHVIFERYADVYMKTVSDRSDLLRSIAYAHRAWRWNRNRQDLAHYAARQAFEVGETRKSLDICQELLQEPNPDDTQGEVRLLYADVLLEYLVNGSTAQYAWEDLVDAIMATREYESNGIQYEITLARIWREKLLTPDEATRTEYAYGILNNLVAEHREDPMVWLARHQFSVDYRVADESSDGGSAGRDLQQALSLVEQALPEDQAIIYSTAASHAKQKGEIEEAKRFLSLAISKDSIVPQYYVALAELNRMSGESASHRETIAILKQGLAIVGDRELLLLLPLASVQIEIEDWDAAAATIELIEGELAQFSGPSRTGVQLGASLLGAQIVWHNEGVFPAIHKLESVVNDEDMQVHHEVSPGLSAQVRVLLAELYASSGMTDQASEQYRQALQFAPKGDVGVVNAIRADAVSVALRAGDLESAELLCRKVLRGVPDSPEALLSMIRIQLERQIRRPLDSQDWSSAEHSFELAREHNVAADKLLLAEVELLEAQGNSDQAKQRLEEALEQAPRVAELWRMSALLYDRTGEYDSALIAADKCIELSPEQIEPYALKATLLEKLNRGQEARELLTQQMQSSVGVRWVAATLEMVRQQLLSGEVDEARLLLLEVQKRDPGNLLVVSSLADLAWASGEWSSLNQIEATLRQLEGEAGTLWRFYRAQRLLEEADSLTDSRYEEVQRLCQSLQRKRPRWSKTSLLLGDVALRAGKTEAAIASYQRAWDLGDRSALLADQLIELLTLEGRQPEAQSYVAQIRTALSLSSRLFESAIPFYLQAGRQAEALELAETWVARRPDDAEANLRLGRVLMQMHSPDEGKSQGYMQRAGEALRQALKLAPSDLDTWFANVEFAWSKPDEPAAISEVLKVFNQIAGLGEFSRTLIAAQICAEFDQPLETQEFYRLAMQSAKGDAESLAVLSKLSEFYLEKLPHYAEHYARAALTVNPEAVAPRHVLLEFLLQSSQAEAVDEALVLLDSQSTSGDSDHLDFERRMRAKLLQKRGGSTDITQAIELVETLLQKTAEDNLMLASLYERAGRIGPAYEILSRLASVQAARPSDRIAFLRFWQQNFLAKSHGQQDPDFAAVASKVYQQLRRQPSQQAEWLRWKLRERQILQSTGQHSEAEMRLLLKELVKVNKNFDGWSDDVKYVWCRSLLQVFLDEKNLASALRFVQDPPAEIQTVQAAIAFCHAMILAPDSSGFMSEANSFLAELLNKYPGRADLARAVGDYQLMSGQNEVAVKSYRLALTSEPGHRLATNNLVLALVELPGRLEEAKSLLAIASEEEVTVEGDASSVLLDTLAVVQLIDQRPTDALVSLEKVLAASPTNAIARIHAAMVYQVLGDQELMKSSFLKALLLGVDESLLSPRDRRFYRKMANQTFILE